MFSIFKIIKFINKRIALVSIWQGLLVIFCSRYIDFQSVFWKVVNEWLRSFHVVEFIQLIRLTDSMFSKTLQFPADGSTHAVTA